MATISLKYLEKINEQLDGIIVYIDAYSTALQKEINSAGRYAQKIADEEMAKLSESASEKLNIIRDKVIDIFKAQYQSAMERVKPIEPLLNADVSLDTVVEIVKSIIAILAAPYQPMIDFISTAVPLVLEISDKIQTIATYQPTIEAPGVEIPPLEIKVEPITPGDITG